MSECCRNCHFLAKTSHVDKPYTFSWTIDERKEGSISNPDVYAASCRMGVWDTGIVPTINNNLQEVLDKDRKGFCFFIETHPGMIFEAAKEMQKRRGENEALRRSHRYTLIGLWIAAIALVANTAVSIYRLITEP